MDDDVIVTAYVVRDKRTAALGQRDGLRQESDKGWSKRTGCVRSRTRAGETGQPLVGSGHGPLRVGDIHALALLCRDRDDRAGAAYRARLAPLPLSRLQAVSQRAHRHAG